tara:strand:+ start:2621 stop:3157 length:537 start_codon:yes stop_codon:yes gene_type:complete
MKESLMALGHKEEELKGLLERDDVDQQALLDTIESMEGEIPDKLDNCMHVIQSFEVEAVKIKAEADWYTQQSKRLKKRAESQEKKAQSLKNNILYFMQRYKQRSITTTNSKHTIYTRVQKDYLSVDYKKLPEEYHVNREAIVMDKTATKKHIQELLDKGVSIDSDCVNVKDRVSLIIK